MVFFKSFSGIVRDSFLGINTQQYDCARPQTCSYQEFLFYDTIQPCRTFSTARFNVCYYLLKNFFRTYHFAPAVRAMKSTLQKQTKQLAAFLRCRKSIRHGSSNDSGLFRSQNIVQNKKAFRNKQYTPKSKDQPYGSDRTHFYVRFNNSNVAMHHPTLLFLLPHKITTIQQKTTKTNNQIKQSEKTIPATTQSKTLSKQTVKTKHNKQTRQTISSIYRKVNHKNNHNKQPTQSLNQKHAQKKLL